MSTTYSGKLSWISQLTRQEILPLFKGRKHSSNESDQLCEVCAKINLQKLFAPSFKNLPKKEFRYTTAHVETHQMCPFCRLIAHVSLPFLPSAPEDITRRSTICITFEWQDEYTIIKRSRKVYVPHLRGDSAARLQLVDASPHVYRDLSKDRLFRARPLKQFADIELVKWWLGLCNERHPDCNKSSGDGSWMEHEIKLVNIEKRCIIKAPGRCEYVALSYVWGPPHIPQLKLQKSTMSRLFTEGGLSNAHEDVPTTILDAMELCSRIGQRLLWVDALCIEQDNPEDQGKQINQMHKMYSNAYFTIVAAQGNGDIPVASSWTGLAGIQKSRDGQQMVETINGAQFANLNRHFHRQLDSCTWNRRAWTMQEMQFSRRLIVCTKQQVFFRCDDALWREDQHLEHDVSVDLNIFDSWECKQQDTDRYSFKQKFNKVGLEAFTQYTELASGICTRDLTNPTDILAAFLGVANTLSGPLQTTFWWGIPISYFDLGLLFESTAGCRTFRREGYPSWSWAGWVGLERQGRIYVSEGSRMRYYREDNEHTLYAEINWHRIEDGKYTAINNSRVTKADAVLQLAKVQSSWRPASFEKISPLIPGLTENELGRLLVFQTSCTFVNIEADVDVTCGLFETLFSADGSMRVINIRRNAPFGKRAIQRVYGSNTATKKIECIVFGSVVERSGNDDRNLQEKGYLKLMVIDTNETGVSERIGIVDVMVRVEEWVKYEPEWKTVFLM